MIKSQVHSGIVQPYLWVTREGSLGELLSVHPELVMGKYLAIASFDSGPLMLCPDEIARGWLFQEGVAYSPKVTSVQDLPYDIFDEWYVFDNPRVIATPPTIFVNFGNFVPGAMHNDSVLPDSPDDAYLLKLQAQFWTWLSRIEPTTYIGNQDNRIIVVTQDKHIWDKIIS